MQEKEEDRTPSSSFDKDAEKHIGEPSATGAVIALAEEFDDPNVDPQEAVAGELGMTRNFRHISRLSDLQQQRRG